MAKANPGSKERQLASSPNSLESANLWPNILYLVLLLLPFVVYSSVYLENYLIYDETFILAGHKYLDFGMAATTVKVGLHYYGRPITFIFYYIFELVFNINSENILFVRLFSLFSMSLFIVALYYILNEITKNIALSFFFAAIFSGHSIIQEHSYYSMLSPYLIGSVIANFGVYFLLYRDKVLLGILLILISWFVFQGSPFSALALIVIYLFENRESEVIRTARCLKATCVFVGCLITYVLIYRLIKENFEYPAYRLVENNMSLLSAVAAGELYRIIDLVEFDLFLNPFIYFYVWDNGFGEFYALQRSIIFGIFLLSLASLPFLKRFNSRKYNTIAVALTAVLIVLSTLPVFADHFSGRQHVWVGFALTGMSIVLISAKAVFTNFWPVESGRSPYRLLATAGVIVVGLSLVGSGSIAARKGVAPLVDFRDFIAGEISKGVALGFSKFGIIVPATVNHDCIDDLCVGYYSHGRFMGEWHLMRVDQYYAYLDFGNIDRKNIEIQVSDEEQAIEYKNDVYLVHIDDFK